MKVRIVNEESRGCGEMFEVERESDYVYFLTDGTSISKCNAEVAEDEKSCDTCGCKDCNLCNENYIKWQPIEKLEKSCDSCKFYGGKVDCIEACGTDWNCWQPIESTRANAASRATGTTETVAFGNGMSFTHPAKNIKPLINLIKLTGKNGFTYYLNVDKINSLTDTGHGVSISTADNDGDYLAMDSIASVLDMLECGK